MTKPATHSPILKRYASDFQENDLPPAKKGRVDSDELTLDQQIDLLKDQILQTADGGAIAEIRLELGELLLKRCKPQSASASSDLDAALKGYESALKFTTEHELKARLLLALGDILRVRNQKKDRDLAIKHYKETLGLFYENISLRAKILMHLAEAYAERNEPASILVASDRDLAIETYQKALAICPKDKTSLLGIASLLYTRNRPATPGKLSDRDQAELYWNLTAVANVL